MEVVSRLRVSTSDTVAMFPSSVFETVTHFSDLLAHSSLEAGCSRRRDAGVILRQAFVETDEAQWAVFRTANERKGDTFELWPAIAATF